MITEKHITLTGTDILDLAGFNDKNIERIRETYPSASITLRGDNLTIKAGDNIAGEIVTIFKELQYLQKRQGHITDSDVNLILQLTSEHQETKTEKRLGIKSEELDDIVLVTKNSYIKPKTLGQKDLYQKAISNEIVFAIGPAGTGKTYLSVAIALAFLKEKQVNKIILSRPAVEAGESLGFLPGDISEKVDPYLKPLLDALEDMIPIDKLRSYFEKNIIEIVPLAYMRGRTLNNAFLILDEAQNSTSMQMKMFLTRLGVNSRAIITGDITQIDLPAKQTSGLVQIQNILQGIEGVAFVYLEKKDVVRHKLVKDIINAYENFNSDVNLEKKHPD